MKRILIILISLLFMGCEKDEELTSINGDGSGGLSCILDGTILNPSGGGITGNKTCRIDYKSDEQIYFFAVGFTTNQFYFTSVRAVAYDIDPNNLEGQTYDLIGMDFIGSEESYGSVSIGRYNVEGRNYSTNNVRNGRMTILNHDYENHTISGTFEFEAINDLGKVIKITDGRFDTTLGQ